MTPDELHARLSAQFGERLGPLQPANRDPFIAIPRELLLELCGFCKTTPGLDFDFLMNLSAVDWPKANQLELVYHLFSYAHRHTLVLKLRVDRSAPVVPSVTSIWKVANWLEREAFDLLGVQFEGHPDLRRLLMPDDWQGHPLRKDYQEAATWHGIETTRDNPLDGFVLLDELKKRLSLSREARRPEPVIEPKP